MVRLILSLFVVLSLTACAGKLNNNWLHNLVNHDDQTGVFNFEWQLKGDTALLPLQVFDNNKKTWLQYPDTSPVPAIFIKTDSGNKLINPVREGQYLVLKQVPEKIFLHGGRQKAELIRTTANINHINNDPGKHTDNNQADAYGSAADLPALPVPDNNKLTSQLAAVFAIDESEKNSLIKKDFDKSVKTTKDIRTNRLVASRPVSSGSRIIAREYSVSPKDINIRHALKNWSKNSEWTFSDEHWSVDVDIPIAGSASFGESFQLAVRELLSATELSDRPLQPCFYSNKVLRVVPLAQRCDRTTAVGVSL